MGRYVLVWLAGSAAMAFGEVVDSILLDIAAVGAAVIGLGVIWTKVIAPAGRIGKKLEAGLDIMLGLPQRMDAVEERLERHSGRLQGIEESVGPRPDLVTRQEVVVRDDRVRRIHEPPFDQGH